MICDDGEEVSYDVVSFDIGSATKGTYSIPGVREYSIPTRPISGICMFLYRYRYF